MTTPRGDGVINVAVPYADGGQVTSTNLNDIVDDAEFNTNAVDDSSVGINGSGKLFVKDDGITTARILNSNVTTAKIADNNVTTAKILDSNVTTAKIVDDGVTQAKIANDAVGADQLASDAVVTASIVDSNVTLAKVANIADDRVLGNISGGAAAPSELTAANVVTMLGTSLINPTSISGSTNTIVFSNGLTLKFGSHTTSGADKTQTVNFSDHGGNFSNDCIYFNMYIFNNTAGDIIASTNEYVRTQSASSVEFNAQSTANGYVYKFIAIGY
jgi:hypothetical protein